MNRTGPNTCLARVASAGLRGAELLTIVLSDEIVGGEVLGDRVPGGRFWLVSAEYGNL